MDHDAIVEQLLDRCKRFIKNILQAPDLESVASTSRPSLSRCRMPPETCCKPRSCWKPGSAAARTSPAAATRPASGLAPPGESRCKWSSAWRGLLDTRMFGHVRCITGAPRCANLLWTDLDGGAHPRCNLRSARCRPATLGGGLGHPYPTGTHEADWEHIPPIRAHCSTGRLSDSTRQLER
jgi:hypothetical protein